MSREPKAMLTVQLPLNLVNRLDHHCRDKQITKVAFIMKAIEGLLEKENA